MTSSARRTPLPTRQRAAGRDTLTVGVSPAAGRRMARAVRRAARARSRCNRSPVAQPTFHKTVLDEFYRIAFRKRIYATIEQLQGDLDALPTFPTDLLQPSD